MIHFLKPTLRVALTAACVALCGQTVALASLAPAGAWTLTPSFASQYVFRGMRMGGPSFQPTAEYAAGNLAAGVWASVPLDNTVPGVSDPEIDLYGSYTKPLSDAFSISVGATWYTFPRAKESAGFYRSTFEPNVGLNYTVNGLRLSPKLYYDTVLDGLTAEVTAFYAVPLTRLGTELDFTAVYGSFKWDDATKNSSPTVKNWGDYWSFGVAMPYQVSANSKIIVGAAYVEGSGNFFKQGSQPRAPNTAAASRGVFTLAYSITL